MASKYEKLKISLRYFLQGRNYHGAVKALNFAESMTPGTRKDGCTPAAQHFAEIAHFLRTLPLPRSLEERILTVAILHDIYEDTDTPYRQLVDMFGQEVADDVATLSKKNKTFKKDIVAYYDEIGASLVAALVKGADRNNNIGSMVGVFTPTKIAEYIEETETLVLPMLKRARRQFPEAEDAFENIKLLLTSQIRIIKHYTGPASAPKGDKEELAIALLMTEKRERPGIGVI